MSNKPKVARKNKKLRLKKIKTPAKIGFTYHIGDMAGCGHIRCIFPSLLMNTIMTKDLKIESFYTNKYSPYPEAYQHTTFAVFQRSATPDQLKMVQHLKSMRKNTSIIYEIDDNLLDIPEWNFAGDFYKKHRETATQIIRTVDGVTTSTEYLKKEYSKFNKNITVTPNHLPKFLWGEAEFKGQDRVNEKPRILYAGSMNHFDLNNDRGDFGKELIDYIIDTMDKYEWVFVGGVPQRIKAKSNDDKRIRYIPWQTIYNLPAKLRSLEADVALAPLEDNRFNRSKSNIKALESVAIGVPVICSNIGPYENLPGAVDTTEQMLESIEDLAYDVDKRKEQWYNMHEKLEPLLFWEDNNNIMKYLNKYLRLVKMTL